MNPLGTGGAADEEPAAAVVGGTGVVALVVAAAAEEAAPDAAAWVFGILYAPAGLPVAFCQKFFAKSSVACKGKSSATVILRRNWC